MPKSRATYRLLTLIIAVCFANMVNAQYKEVVILDTATLNAYKKDIPALKQKNDTAALGKNYKALGDYYYLKSNTDSAIQYYILANKQFEAVKDSFNLFWCHHRIGGHLSFRNGPVKEVLHWLVPAVSYFERNKYYSLAAHASFDISKTYKNAGNMANRSKYINNAEQFNKLEYDTLLAIIIHIGKGEDAREARDFNKALDEFSKGLKIGLQTNYKFFIKICYVNLAGSYLKNNNLKAAAEALRKADSLNHRGMQYESAFLNTILAVKTKNEEQAISSLFRYHAITDSLLKIRDKENFAEQIVRFETEKQMAAIESLKKENILKSELAQRRNRFIYALLGGLVLLFSFGWVTTRNINKRKNLQLQLQKQEEQFAIKLAEEKKEKQLAELNTQLAEVQLIALNAQMNPHFIFNCMNSVQKYILKNEKDKALDFLQNFSELMRNVLDNSTKPKVALDEEINMLNKYILLEQQRLENQFDFTVEVDPNLQTDFFEIPGMIIQPYVENAIWHGLMNLPAVGEGLQTEITGTDISKKRNGLLRLQFSREKGNIKCVIQDNGIGREKASELEKVKSPRRKSFGMAISQKRLELLKMDNVNVPEILIEDLKDSNHEPIGTRVTLFIQTD